MTIQRQNCLRKLHWLKWWRIWIRVLLKELFRILWKFISELLRSDWNNVVWTWIERRRPNVKWKPIIQCKKENPLARLRRALYLIPAEPEPLFLHFILHHARMDSNHLRKFPEPTNLYQNIQKVLNRIFVFPKEGKYFSSFFPQDVPRDQL